MQPVGLETAVAAFITKIQQKKMEPWLHFFVVPHVTADLK